MTRQYPQPPQQPRYEPPTEEYPRVSRQWQNGYGLVAFWTGVPALFISWIPLVGILSWLMIPFGVGFGIAGLRRCSRREANNNVLTGTGLFLCGLALIVSFVMIANLGKSLTATPSFSNTPSRSVPAVVQQESVPVAPVQSGPMTEFPGGQNLAVGEDIAPGKYKTTGPSGEGFMNNNCYYHISKDPNGSFQIGDSNGNVGVGKSGTVTLKAGRYFTSTGDCVWTKVG